MAPLLTPDTSVLSTRISTAARVVANVPLCREHFRLDLHVDHFPETEPGQFVQLACRDAAASAEATELEFSGEHSYGNAVEHTWLDGTWPTLADPDLVQRQAMLRRPFSLAGRSDLADGVVLSVIHRVIGVGTDWLSRLQIGDHVGVLGPLGNRFPKPASGFGIFVGGGVGIPPMLYLAQRWQTMQSSPAIQLLAFCGAMKRDLLPLTIVSDTPADPTMPSACIRDVAEFGVNSVVSTDDGSFGFHGLITVALERYLDHTLRSLSTDQYPTLYTCGPEGMMKRVAAIAAERGLDCFVAVEGAMACGMATCQSCVIRKRTDDGWRYALSCTEGPIFNATDLLW